MSNFLKIFGVICGILALGFCLCSGHALVTSETVDMGTYHSFGFFIIGMGFFAGPLLIIFSLKSGNSASAATQKPVRTNTKPNSRPAKKSRPAPGKPAGKAPAKGGTNSGGKDDVTVIYVGNLSPEANETVLRTAFSGFGEIHKIKIIKDRGRPKGFGFVEMYNKNEALKAIEAMDGEELAGRPLKVNEAKPKTKRPPRSQKPENSENSQTSIDDEPIRPNMFE